LAIPESPASTSRPDDTLPEQRAYEMAQSVVQEKSPPQKNSLGGGVTHGCVTNTRLTEPFHIPLVWIARDFQRSGCFLSTIRLCGGRDGTGLRLAG